MLSLKCKSKAYRRVAFRAFLLFLNISFAYANDGPKADDVIFVPMPLASAVETRNPVQVSEPGYTNLLSQDFLQDTVTRVPFFGNEMNTVSEYESRIVDIENEAGPFATELTETLHSLGAHYLDQKRYQDALASFEREEHIYRVNFGLYSEEQLPSVRAQISALIGGEMLEEADDKQRYLLYLMEKCYGRDDLRLLPEVVNYAEWNMSRFNEIIRFDFSDMPALSFGAGGTETEYRMKAFDKLNLAAQNYARAVKMLVDNKDFGNPELYRLEERLVESALFRASQNEMLHDPDGFLAGLDLEDSMYEKGDYARMIRDAYKFGVSSYERQLAYIVKAEGNMARYINTLLAFGDWYMLFGKQGAAFDKYGEANKLIASLDVSEESVNAVLNPEVPVVMPTFTATMQSIDSLDRQGRMLNPYKGYVDVSFRINRNGNARHLEVLDKSANTTSSIETRLLSILTRSQFRPRFGDQLLAQNEDEISLRYYYTY